MEHKYLGSVRLLIRIFGLVIVYRIMMSAKKEQVEWEINNTAINFKKRKVNKKKWKDYLIRMLLMDSNQKIDNWYEYYHTRITT